MTRVCHLFDRSAGWEQRVGVTQLIHGMSARGDTHELAALDPTVRDIFRSSDLTIRVCAPLGGVRLLANPSVSRWVARTRGDVIHAWGVQAAECAHATCAPLVVSVFDPGLTKHDVHVLRAVARSRRMAVACSTVQVRRRLVEQGVPPETCVVVRPGVDFAVIRAARQASIRETMGIDRGDRVVLVDGAARAGGAWLEACLAPVLLDIAGYSYRVVAMGDNQWTRSAMHNAGQTPLARPVLKPPPDLTFEQVLSAVDVLLVVPGQEVSTTSIAWAFGAQVAVVAAATYSVTELVTHKLNGLLFKHDADKPAVGAIATLLRDRAAQDKVRQTAHGQAYEVFSVRRCVQQHATLYENVIAAAPPGQGIGDPAVIG